MNKPPYFPFYPKDWDDVKVRRMSYEAQGIYMRILCFMWKDSKDQCSILNNDGMISQALGISKQKWLRNKKEILFDGDPILRKKRDKLISKRLQSESQKMMEYRQKQSEKGKKSAFTRGTAVKQRLNNGSTERQPEGNSSSSSSSSPSNKESLKNKPVNKFTDDDIELTNLLIERIIDNNPRSKVSKMTDIQKGRWYNECRLLRESDKWSVKDIEIVILYTQQDEFEQTVVLSMGKLRKRFDSLVLKAKREYENRSELRIGRQ